MSSTDKASQTVIIASSRYEVTLSTGMQPRKRLSQHLSLSKNKNGPKLPILFQPVCSQSEKRLEGFKVEQYTIKKRAQIVEL